jgi:RNase adaptor protein for sRNA GlmZ degradation
MHHVLITGMSGVGKSTVLEALRARGHACIDMDDPSLSFQDDAGHQHWRTDALLQLLEAHPERTTFVVGCAEEQAGLYDRFRAIVLLSAPLEVMVDRIRSRTSHAFGQDPAEMARILDDQRTVEPLLRRSCTHEIVTTLPVGRVVERVLEIAGGAG